MTKKFPQQFGEWLQTLPPSLDLELDPMLATLREAPISASVRLDVEPAGVDWFDLRVALDVPELDFTPEELKALLGARGGWVRLGAKGWRKLALPAHRGGGRSARRSGPLRRATSPRRSRSACTRCSSAHQRAARLLPADRASELKLRVAELQARVMPAQAGGITAELRPVSARGLSFSRLSLDEQLRRPARR